MRTTIITVLVASRLTAHAQGFNFGAIDEGTNIATLTTGAEYGLVLGAGYAHALSVAERPLVLGGDLTFALGAADPRDFRLRAGAFAPILGHGRWKLIGGISSTIRGTNNDIAQMVDVGADVAVLAGHYAPRWFAAAEAGFDWALATHIDHGNAYRMLVYADARDGWYGNAGGMLHYGIEAGVTCGANDVILRAGQLRDVAGHPAMFPIYGTLTYDRRW